MTTPELDQRSLERRARDEQIACGAVEAELEAGQISPAWSRVLARAVAVTHEEFEKGRHVCDGVNMLRAPYGEWDSGDVSRINSAMELHRLVGPINWDVDGNVYLRAAARLDHVAIIVVSGDSDPETPERVRRLGADAYFAKPYSPAAVRDTLERLLHENSPPSP